MGLVSYLRDRPSKQFLAVIAAFAAGIGLHSLRPFNTLGEGRFFLLAAAFGLMGLVFVWERLAFRLPALILLAAAAGFLRFDFFTDASAAAHISQRNGSESIRIEGLVIALPEVREANQRLIIEVEKAESEAARGRLLVRVPTEPRYAYGDRLRFTCRIDRPTIISGFNEALFLLPQRIFSICNRPESLVRSSGGGIPVVAAVYGLKDRLVESANRYLPEPQASLAAGLLFGDRRLPAEIVADFQATGTSHIIAVSGYNVTVITVLVFSLFGLLPVPRRAAVVLTMAFLAAFIIATGASASVLRAAIMGTIPFAAEAIGRPSRSPNALFFAGFLMLLVNPALLIFDIGFALSFAATAGLIWLAPALVGKFGWKRRSGFHVVNTLRETLVMTIGAVTMTFPLILAFSGRFSVVAPLSNILVLFAVPPAMLLSFLAGIAGMIWAPIAEAVSIPATLVLTYIIEVPALLARIPWAQLMVGRISFLAAAFFYAAVFIPFLVPRPRRFTPVPVAADVDDWIIIDNQTDKPG